MSNGSGTGGAQFYSALQQKAMSAVQSIFKSTLYPIQYPAQGDFMWYWQNPNQVFNDGTYQYVNALVSPGQLGASAGKTSISFTTKSASVPLVAT